MHIGASGLNPSLTTSIQSTAEKIASGKAVNKASDNPAAIQILQQFNSQIQGESAAFRNVIDGISALQTAQGGLSQVTDSLQQLRELGIQAGNGTLNSSDRDTLQAQADQLIEGIKDSLNGSTFNDRSLLNNADDIQTQTGSEADQQQSLSSFDLLTEFEDVGLFNLDFSLDKINDTLTNIDKALDITQRVNSAFGAEQNRLGSTANTLSNSILNQSSSRSQIEDADYAELISLMTKQQLNRDVEIAMLGQANANRSQVLQLLKT
ncbi:MAG: hypothetical protein OFPI_01310 [Osedax symbiont Rs2]|nr:MAG: hypothetical protein OFPI_01310 [Osedax symbiont Rs2]